MRAGDEARARPSRRGARPRGGRRGCQVARGRPQRVPAQGGGDDRARGDQVRKRQRRGDGSEGCQERGYGRGDVAARG